MDRKQLKNLPTSESEHTLPGINRLESVINFTDSELPLHHFLHAGYSHPTLQRWQQLESQVSADNLVLPLFICDADNDIQPINAMPGISRYGVNRVLSFLQPLVDLGLRAVLLFGFVVDQKKDEQASAADSDDNPVVRAIRLLRSRFPQLLIICDVCMCPYSSTGHCGFFRQSSVSAEEYRVDNGASVTRLAEIALAYARAGAHVVAPSDMLDGRIYAIKVALREAGLLNSVAVLSYSAKYASAFYGPFRDAAGSHCNFRHVSDRSNYQLPCGARSLGLKAAERDVEHGADMIMVKPAMPYLDIVRDIKTRCPTTPLFAYQVSGEYAMLVHAGKAGVFELKSAVLESLKSMRRAGADVIITYFTPQVLLWLNEYARQHVVGVPKVNQGVLELSEKLNSSESAN